MNMYYLLVAILLVTLTGCQAVTPEVGIPTAPEATEVVTEEATATGEIESTPVLTGTVPVSDFAGLVDALRAAGATVEPQGEMEQAFLSVSGQQILVNGGNVQLFEYPSTEAAAADAGQISPDGSSTATTMITWVEPPHFYRKDRLLVLYVGSDEATQELLADLLGPQFAGQ